MSNNVQQVLRTTAFGELHTEHKRPLAQISAEYGLLNNVITVIDAGSSGVASTISNNFVVDTGTNSDGLASILSAKQGRYRPGEGLLGMLSAVFTQGVPNSRQAAGLITSENSFVFGYIGDTFGIAHAHGGEPEVEELTLTSPAAGAENASVTIGSTLYTVPLTSGTLQHNAYEIATSLNTQVTNFDFSSNGVTVVAKSLLPQPFAGFLFFLVQQQ